MNKTLKTATVLGLGGAMVALVSVSARSNDYGRHDNYGEQLVKRGYELAPPGVKLNLGGRTARWSAWAATSSTPAAASTATAIPRMPRAAIPSWDKPK